MAHFNSYKAMPITSPPVSIEISPNDYAGWNTLEELQRVVTTKGFVKAQVDQAIETVGADPFHVATYLQRQAFTFDDPRE